MRGDVIDDRPSNAPSTVVLELEGLRCLLVDDDADTQDLMLFVLEERGAVVSVAGSADEAMVRLAEASHDVLISDIGLPHTDGMSLIRAVRDLAPERGGSIPAVAVTGYARVQDKNDALRAGFQAHLAKPIEPAELVRTIATIARTPVPSPVKSRDP